MAKKLAGIALMCTECGTVGPVNLETGDMVTTCSSCGEVVDPEVAARTLRDQSAKWTRYAAWLQLAGRIATDE
jgi:hypothetical protein